MPGKSLTIRTKIKATPEEVYRALTHPFAIELWTGAPAEMSEEPGSDFSLLDGNIVGRNLAFEPGSSIRQQWFFGEDEPSEVLLEIFPDKGHSQLKVVHTEIPEEAYENMKEGWKESYLGPLKDFFEK